MAVWGIHEIRRITMGRKDKGEKQQKKKGLTKEEKRAKKKAKKDQK